VGKGTGLSEIVNKTSKGGQQTKQRGENASTLPLGKTPQKGGCERVTEGQDGGISTAGLKEMGTIGRTRA